MKKLTKNELKATVGGTKVWVADENARPGIVNSIGTPKGGALHAEPQFVFELGLLDHSNPDSRAFLKSLREE